MIMYIDSMDAIMIIIIFSKQCIAKKSADILEMTKKEMEPVFNKYQLDYENELAELELKYQQEESKHRSFYQNALQETLEMEEKRVKSDVVQRNKSLEFNLMQKMDAINADYKDRKASVTGQYNFYLNSFCLLSVCMCVDICIYMYMCTYTYVYI